jgi:hypothetical protein
MEDMISGLIEKCGLSEEQANKVSSFMQDNASKVPEWLGESDAAKDIAKKIPGVGSLF